MEGLKRLFFQPDRLLAAIGARSAVALAGKAAPLVYVNLGFGAGCFSKAPD